MYKIYCFDFDGTITSKDTLLEFISFVKGRMHLLLGFVIYSPFLILMKCHLYPNYKIKEKIFAYFFKDMSEDCFNSYCYEFASCCHNTIIRPKAIEEINKAISEKTSIFIVSASIDNWVAPFFTSLIDKGIKVKVLGTKIEIKDGVVTGKFLSANCYGAEKVCRIKNELKEPRNNYYITAYGDSRGDKEMLDYADKGFYKLFRH